jgi:hypothetical protein
LYDKHFVPGVISMSVAETQRKGVFIPHPPDDALICGARAAIQLTYSACYSGSNEAVISNPAGELPIPTKPPGYNGIMPPGIPE